MLTITSEEDSDTQGIYEPKIILTLSQDSTIIETIPFEAILYSDDPTNAILAPCGGIDIARPDEP